MVHFVGAGSGAADLITLRGARLLGEADVVVYAGSLINPELLELTRPGCSLYNSAKMTLEELPFSILQQAEREGKPPSASTPEIPASMGPSGNR